MLFIWNAAATLLVGMRFATGLDKISNAVRRQPMESRTSEILSAESVHLVRRTRKAIVRQEHLAGSAAVRMSPTASDLEASWSSLSMNLMAKQYAAQFSSPREDCDATKECEEKWKTEKTCVARVENGLPTHQHFLMKVFPHDVYISGAALCTHTTWEWGGVRRFLDQLPQDGWNFLDIGANLGSWTLPITVQLAGRGKVIAVEAHPHTSDALQQSVKLNKFDERVVVYNNAIVHNSTITQTLCMSQQDAESSRNAGGNHAEGDACTTSEQVRTMSLDDLYKREPAMSNVIAVKLDCEGCEGQALMGGSRFLTETPPCFLGFEVTDKYLCSHLSAKEGPLVGLKLFLDHHGYDTSTLKQDRVGTCAEVLARSWDLQQTWATLPRRDLASCMSRFPTQSRISQK